jgi:hypothetical protein
MMLTDAQIQQFKEDGFLVLPGLIDSQHAANLVAAWQDVRQELHQNTGRYRRSDRFVEGDLPPILDKVYEYPGLVQTAIELLGDPNISIYLRNFLLKDANWDGPVHTHQDMPYASGSQQKIIAFVPLQPQSEENGGLRLLKSTHKYGNIGIRGTIHPDAFDGIETVCPALHVGDVLIINVLLWHYSEKRMGSSDRPMFQIMYQTAKDGTYSGLPAPTLVAGEWQTTHFMPYQQGITPDLITYQAAHQQEVAGLKSMLQQAQTELEKSHDEVSRLKVQIQAMESSKFWRIRSQWLNLKRKIGLATN